MTEDKNENEGFQSEEELYEIGFHILPTVGEEDINVEVTKIKNVLDEAGARTTTDEGLPKLTGLAYEISKKIDNQKKSFSQAYFGWVKFEALPENIEDIKEKVKELPNILRFMVVKTVRSSKMTHGRPAIAKKPKTEKTLKDKKLVKKEEKKEEKSLKDVDEAIDELVVE